MKLAANTLPEKITIKLFGDRKKYGLIPHKDDLDWILWEKEYLNFYDTTQKKGLGSFVNDSGYKVLKEIDLTGLTVCEIGPGSLPHRKNWLGTPKKYIGVDINQDFLDLLPHKANCPFEQVKIESGVKALPLPSKSIDILLSFYSFEHLNPLSASLDEYKRVLKPNGRIIGAIPNEGGFAWGLGRYLTSRRWIHANTQINYDKIICWEHPNFADKILNEMNKRFTLKQVSHFPPLSFPSLNLSLVTKFIYEKK
jgi:SAM-dependent methyltransferase